MDRWDDSIEQLLIKYCDESQCRIAVHRREYYKFKKLNTCFSLPVICLSALSGSFQFLSKGFEDFEHVIVLCTGSLSILTSVISAVAAYLKLGQSESAHEQAASAWLGFYNEIRHQLSLAREKRMSSHEFLQNAKTQYDRLFEISPICSVEQINLVKKKIKAYGDDQFHPPPYMNGFSHTKVYEEYEENSV